MRAGRHISLRNGDGGWQNSWRKISISQNTLGSDVQNRNKLIGTHISTPAVGRQNLVFLVEVKNLYEGQPIADADRLRRVVDRPADSTDARVVVEQVLDQSLLVRQSYAV